MNPRILISGTAWRWVVSFTPTVRTASGCAPEQVLTRCTKGVSYLCRESKHKPSVLQLVSPVLLNSLYFNMRLGGASRADAKSTHSTRASALCSAFLSVL
jgi:hypothetical protein